MLDVFRAESQQEGDFCKAVKLKVESELGNRGVKFNSGKAAHAITPVVLPYSQLSLRQYEHSRDQFVNEAVGKVLEEALSRSREAYTITALEQVTVEIGRDVQKVAFNLVIGLWRNA